MPTTPLADVLALVNRMRYVLMLLLGVIVFGTYGYHLIEGWSMIDGLYMTVITVGTIGYGETNPLTFKGRIFTMFLILFGVSVVTYAFTTLTSIVVEGQLSEVFKRRRMEKEIAKLQDHFVVCGAGHAGSVIIEELFRTKRPFVVVEKDRTIADPLVERGMLVVFGDATEDETLKAAGIERAGGVFAVLTTDQNNAFVALTARGLNPRVRIVSAQKEHGVREKLIRSGADNVVNSEFIGGMRMVSEMIRPAAVGFLDSMIRDSSSVHRFEDIRVTEGSPLAGKRVSDVRQNGPKAPLLVSIRDAKSGRYEINPADDKVIQAGDTLVLVGDALILNVMRNKAGAA